MGIESFDYLGESPMNWGEFSPSFLKFFPKEKHTVGGTVIMLNISNCAFVTKIFPV
jgi:hypothetical protein